jgi:hypothetical protein
MNFLIPTSTYLQKKMFGPNNVTFSLCWAIKTHFQTGRHENKEKRFLYFGLYNFGLILLLWSVLYITLLEIENPKNPKIDSRY